MTSPQAGSDAPAPIDALPPRSVHRARLHGRSTPERAWTPLGTVDAGVLGCVDGAGAVQVREASWTLDWWVGAEDRWHHPSREVTVRQRPVDDAPVVETALRVPGGDVVHRAYGAQAAAGEWRGPAIVVEVENRTAVPVALAFAVRPQTLDGPGRVAEVSSDGPVISVDGAPRVLLARDPARHQAGRVGTVAARLAAGDDLSHAAKVGDPSGELEVAFVVPLPHTATARVLLPVGAPAARGRGRGAVMPSAPWEAPTAAQVASGWSVHGGDEVRIVAPEPGWDEALVRAARTLLLAGPDEVGACLDRSRALPAGPPASVRAAEVAEAMARVGSVDGLDAIALALADAQRLGGEARLADRSDGSVALLHAAAAVLAGPRREARADDLVAPVAVAIRRLRKGRATAHGLAPSAVRALRTIAPVLVSAGQPEVAEDALAAAAALGGTQAPRSLEPAVPSATGERSTLATALSVRDALARGAGVDGLRALWDEPGAAGRSDAEVDVDGVGVVPAGVIGFDTAELAARTSALLDLFAADHDLGPDLLTALPASWLGNGIEAHGLATPWGAVSYAVRWHGDRAALLWEIRRPEGLTARSAEPVVRSSGLDPAWSATGWEGEALIGPIAGAAGPADGAGPDGIGEGDSFA